MNNLKLHRGRKCELNLVKKLTVYNKFATEVERIRRRVQKVKDRSSGYHLEVARDGGVPSNDSFIHWKDPRLAFSPMEKADIVGIDNPVSELSSWLFSMGSKSTVLSLVGMGGVGKTRVAKRVYNSNSNNFASCVRVTVSQSFKIVDILESNINEFGIARSLEGSSNESEKELQSKLLNYLNDHVRKKSFLVAFVKRHERTSANEHRGLATRLVVRCHGLSLANVVIGGILSRKPLTPLEWRNILHERQWKVHEGANEYFKELLDPNMLLIGVVEDDGDAVSCRLHDVELEFAIPIAKEEILSEFYGGDCNFRTLIQKTCRLFIAGNYK
ncbi:hypothetical protein AMTR_s00017p00249240 [Amborella trichopoda]|uniref:NB-ARC domain-containing protein n=1 Tax=Amborella trichopoda TaxID=13333 RepID=W1PM64_AMBTC|nr:hypothetical protein AMTR_s00017p00249240 [Amborella trichopoda]